MVADTDEERRRERRRRRYRDMVGVGVGKWKYDRATELGQGLNPRTKRQAGLFLKAFFPLFF